MPPCFVSHLLADGATSQMVSLGGCAGFRSHLGGIWLPQ